MLHLGMPTLPELPCIEDHAALCARLGLQFVELNMNLPMYQPGAVDEKRLARAAARYGVYYTVHLDEKLDVSDFNPYVAAAWRRTVRESIALAGRLGVPVLNMHLSRGVYFTLPARRTFLYEEYREKYLQGMREFRDECTALLGGGETVICVENCDGYTGFQREALELLLESPAFGLTFDIGHAHCAGGADEGVILAHREKLHHFHFHDAAGKSAHLALGCGEMEPDKYLRLAEQCGGRVVLETKTAAGLEGSAAWMRRRGI